MSQNKDLSVKKRNLLCRVVKQRSAQIMLINHTQLDKEPITTNYDNPDKNFHLSNKKTQTSKLC